MYNYTDITTVHLEITQRCQAACPMCDRNENGGPDNRHINNAELSLADCKRIFPPNFIKQINGLGMERNDIKGNLIIKFNLKYFEIVFVKNIIPNPIKKV